MFVDKIIGTLMRVEPHPDTRFQFEVWFDYTKSVINTIREGAFLAVPNFATTAQDTHYSILEVSSVLPVHYALGSDTSGFPGFVEEAARSAALDWEQQDESTEDTTKIRCLAVPTNLEMLLRTSGDPAVQDEENLPMVGSRVQLFNTDYTQRLANRGILPDVENILTVGHLIRDEEVNIWLRIEDLMKVHFGIFGFTGAGKSNFVSTLTRRILSESRETVKVVIVDLMSEYTTLLIDQLVDRPESLIVSLGLQTVPQSLVNYYADPDADKLNAATRDMLRSTLFPKGLRARASHFEAPIQRLIESRQFRIWVAQDLTIGRFVEGLDREVLRGNMGNFAAQVRQLFDSLVSDFLNTPFSENAWGQIDQRLRQVENQNPPATAAANLRTLRQRLMVELQRPRVELPQNCRVTIPELLNALDRADQRALFILQAHDPDELRRFISMLGDFAYERRRQSGRITPLVSFIFDEADEFIPQRAEDSYAESKAVAMTLARRGRKFGLGIGIATQRVRYLDTSIMAQPHTYFVSKLPRQTDRQVVAEAFGISEDMFRQTFKFRKGDWLVASYDAAGLEAVPLPIHVDNAEQRIREFLEGLGRQNRQQ